MRPAGMTNVRGPTLGVSKRPAGKTDARGLARRCVEGSGTRPGKAAAR